MSSPQTENKCPKCKRVLTRRWIRKELNLFRLKCLVCKKDVLIVTDEDCPRCSQKLIKTWSFGYSRKLGKDSWGADEIHCDLCGYEKREPLFWIGKWPIGEMSPDPKSVIKSLLVSIIGFPLFLSFSVFAAFVARWFTGKFVEEGSGWPFLIFVIVIVAGTALGCFSLKKLLSKWL